MESKEINKLIAEACGWRLIHGDFVSWGKVNERVGGKTIAWRNPQGVCYEPSWQHLPNYYASLDACAEFERTLDKIQRREYVRQLYHITENDFGAHCATPEQRCEAFLRIKGLWVETPVAGN